MNDIITNQSLEILLLTDLLNAGIIEDKIYELAITKIRKDAPLQATSAILFAETA